MLLELKPVRSLLEQKGSNFYLFIIFVCFSLSLWLKSLSQMACKPDGDLKKTITTTRITDAFREHLMRQALLLS